MMLRTFKATAKNNGKGLVVESAARNFKITYDEPEKAGGTNQGLNPMEGLLTAIGACQAIVASAFARFHNFKYEEFYIEIEGDLDPDGYTGRNPNIRKGFSEIRYKMHFKTNESKEKTEAYAKFVEETCPVTDTVAKGVNVVLTGVEIE